MLFDLVKTYLQYVKQYKKYFKYSVIELKKKI